MSTSSKKRPRAAGPGDRGTDRLKVRTVALAVATQVWPLPAFLGLLLAAALAWYVRSGDRVLLGMAWGFFKTGVLGLVGSFVLHESAHAALLRRIPTVTRIGVERTAWRTSVTAEGEMTARQLAAVAVAGPLTCVAVGTVLRSSGLDQALAWWYLAHAGFLLPFFGDGRVLRQALRAARRPAAGDG